MIRTINYRLRTNDKIIIERNKNGISVFLFALRTEKVADIKSAFTKQTARKPNTLKSAMIQKRILEKDPLIEKRDRGLQRRGGFNNPGAREDA